MNRKLKKVLCALGVTITLAGTAPALADGYYMEPSPRDIEMCVGEIGAHADYDESGKVLHDVHNAVRRSVGYVFEINTKVYGKQGGAVIREYETLCMATGGRKPSKFHISEQDL